MKSVKKSVLWTVAILLLVLAVCAAIFLPTFFRENDSADSTIRILKDESGEYSEWGLKVEVKQSGDESFDIVFTHNSDYAFENANITTTEEYILDIYTDEDGYIPFREYVDSNYDFEPLEDYSWNTEPVEIVCDSETKLSCPVVYLGGLPHLPEGTYMLTKPIKLETDEGREEKNCIFKLDVKYDGTFIVPSSNVNDYTGINRAAYDIDGDGVVEIIENADHFATGIGGFSIRIGRRGELLGKCHYRDKNGHMDLTLVEQGGKIKLMGENDEVTYIFDIVLENGSVSLTLDGHPVDDILVNISDILITE